MANTCLFLRQSGKRYIAVLSNKSKERSRGTTRGLFAACKICVCIEPEREVLPLLMLRHIAHLLVLKRCLQVAYKPEKALIACHSPTADFSSQ